jgi:hypothetical protein
MLQYVATGMGAKQLDFMHCTSMDCVSPSFGGPITNYANVNPRSQCDHQSPLSAGVGFFLFRSITSYLARCRNGNRLGLPPEINDCASIQFRDCILKVVRMGAFKFLKDSKSSGHEGTRTVQPLIAVCIWREQVGSHASHNRRVDLSRSFRV